MFRVCALDDLNEGQSRGFLVAGIRVFVVRKSGQLYAYRNWCPHREIPLEWQSDQFLDDSGTLIRCATHGALFLIESGECIAGPCEGDALQKLNVQIKEDGLWVDV
jgi:nitrite reductase/ring-hydroxylating ferredoxin subunit